MFSEPTSLTVLMAKAEKYATADSAMRIKVTASDKVVPTPATPKPAGDNPGGQNNYKRKADQTDSRSNSKLVASVEGETSAPQASPPRNCPNRSNTNWLPKQSFDQLLDAPYKIHSGAQPSSHTLRQCNFARRLSQGDGLPAPPGAQAAPRAPAPIHAPAPPPPPRDDGHHQDDYPHQDGAFVVFTSEGDDKHSLRQRRREVNATVPPVPQYMHWSDKPITWSRVDHPAVMPNPGSYTLVLDPTFASKRLTCRFSRVLVEGGSSINILYLDTLLKLGLKETDVLPISTVFHGIVPGQSCSPIGKIQLDVLFGDKAHFRRESIWFEVVDLSSPYHALLGRLALGKFTAILHYAYLKMKMSGPKGIITVVSDYKKSLECAQDSSRLADALVIAEEKWQIDRLVA
ncbi:hypothetical protein ZWY2020_010641 [Hordeum vulgare]|nr:hypothetical protein ZWY2020_010641 [Hordeum vulgare]